MDRFGPTGKVSKTRVHLLRWSPFPFPGRTSLILRRSRSLAVTHSLPSLRGRERVRDRERPGPSENQATVGPVGILADWIAPSQSVGKTKMALPDRSVCKPQSHKNAIT